jgi:phenylacetate-CoA ligase
METVLGPPPRPDDQSLWDPENQAMDAERRRVLQLERLRHLVDAALQRPVPMFEAKLAAAGIESGRDLRDVDDLAGIPLTRKQDLRESEAAAPPFGDYRFTDQATWVRVGSSSGTTGTPTLAVWTRHDLWIEYESAARAWWRNGWRPGQVITHAHPAYLYGGGVMLSGSLEYFGALNLWVPPPETDELAEKGIRMWQRVHPDVSMVAFSLGRYQEVAAKLGLDLHTDVGLPSFELHGGGGPGLPLMTAGAECYAFCAGPCRHSPGGHINEDWAIIQAVDPSTGREVPDGQWGDLVVTTLDRDNGFLRYDLDEAVAIVRGPCPCGETTSRGFWGGRFADLLACQGRRFQLSELESALRSVRAVTKPTLEYVVVRPIDAAAPLQVRVELAGGEPDSAAAACRAALRERLGIDAAVTIVEREALQRSGYKAIRLVDE